MAQDLRGSNASGGHPEGGRDDLVMGGMDGVSRACRPGYGVPPSAVLAELPPFPVVALRALKLVANSDTCLRDLHDLIRTDQVFSAELLRIANCPLYGIRSQIKSTMQAVILLGFKRVRAVVLTIGVKNYLGAALKIPAVRACWRHSLACAMISEELAKLSFLGTRFDGFDGLLDRPPALAMPFRWTTGFDHKSASRTVVDKDVAYTAGMIHDVGRLALAVTWPQAYADLQSSTGDGSRDMLQREREAFGMDHCEAGNALGKAWNFPHELIEVMFRHHAPMDKTAFTLLTAVQLGCRMSDALGFGAGGAANPAGYEELIRELPEGQRQHFDCDPEELARAVAHKINTIEPI